jgi:hypothetical protein
MIIYRSSKLAERMLNTYVLFPRQAKRKKRRLRPSVDFLWKFLTTCGILEPR